MTVRFVCIEYVIESSSYNFVSCEVSVVSDDASGFKCKPKPHNCALSEELMVLRMLK
jgi:hypothetical protein